jgi:acetylornithine deacetylase/succinyl-diaminopimelate desuccinylase-like protein
MHVKAFEAMYKSGELACNVKFMFEGEEEVGSKNLEKFVRANTSLLKADVVLVSDTGIINNETPSICVGLRGLSYVEVEVTGPNRDLHSGLYGGAVANPINILSKMIASLHNNDGSINIPGFYSDVIEVSKEDRFQMAKAPFKLNEYKKDLDINEVYGEDGYTTNERNSIRPSLDVNGVWGGYIGEGAKTVLPSKAYAKISMRLVPNQSSSKITDLFENHFKKIAPESVKVKVTPHHGGEGVVIPTDFPAFLAAKKAMEKTFGKTPIPVRSGGSIPIVPMFEEVLGLKTILLGFGLDSDVIHSPNEHFGLFNFYKGIETIPYFYQNFTELMKNK